SEASPGIFRATALILMERGRAETRSAAVKQTQTRFETKNKHGAENRKSEAAQRKSEASRLPALSSFLQKSHFSQEAQ
ncbi:uncharacterized, partial [Tachysurus ichikawai]